MRPMFTARLKAAVVVSYGRMPVPFVTECRFLCPRTIHSQAFLLDGRVEEYLAEGFTYFDFPLEYCRPICTMNILKRMNKEIKRCTRAVGVFTNETSCLRLVTALLMETIEEWQIGKKNCITKSVDC